MSFPSGFTVVVAVCVPVLLPVWLPMASARSLLVSGLPFPSHSIGFSVRPFQQYSLWMTCVEGWGNYHKVLNLRSEVYFYLAKQITKLGIAFHLAPQPVTLTSDPAPVLHMKAVERERYMQGQHSAHQDPSVHKGCHRTQGSERRSDPHRSFHGPLAVSCRKSYREAGMFPGTHCEQATFRGGQPSRRTEELPPGSGALECFGNMRPQQKATREAAVHGTGKKQTMRTVAEGSGSKNAAVGPNVSHCETH